MQARWTAPAACALALVAVGSQADPKGDALLAKVRSATAKIKSLQADVAITAGDQNISARFEGIRPNQGRLVMKDDSGERITVSDGTSAYMVMPGEKLFQKIPASAAPRMLTLLPGSPLDIFYNPATAGKGHANRMLSPRKVGGKSYQAVELTVKSPPMKQVLLVSPAGLVEGMEANLSGPGGQTQKITFWLKNVKANAPLKGEQFAYTPPADFTEPKGPEDSLLAVGTKAPDFMLSQPGNLGLYGPEKALKEKKAVLVNFWFYS